MAADQRPLSEALSSNSSSPSGRGRWHWQRVARAGWVVIACALLVAFIVSIPAYLQLTRTICTLPDPSNCPTGQLTLVYVRVLNQLHLSVAATAGFLAVLTLAVSGLFWAFGLLIFWRRSQEWLALFISLLFVLWGAIGLDAFMPTAHTPLLLQILYNAINTVIGPLFFLLLFTFPTGRFTPRWTWVLFALIFVENILSALPITANLIPGAVVVATSYLLPIIVQFYRYMRVYDAVQRQQTKWFVYGVSVVIALLFIEGGLSVLAPDSPWYQLFNGPMWLLIWTIVLISVSFPILRYRLWDIDVIINRTLIYGSLTLLLLVLYVGLILSLQTLVQAMTGSLSQQPLVIVSSTLVIVALFQPLRHRLQTLIDRRFYRRKYDAARVITAFSTLLRQEVDLDQLHEQLLEVVQETMQPTHVSLWMRKPRRTTTSSLKVNKLSPPEARSLH